MIEYYQTKYVENNYMPHSTLFGETENRGGYF